MIIHEPISWWADKLEKNDYFSLARYGDGEALCMFGHVGKNSHGCEYLPELKRALLSTLDAPILHGLQRIPPEMHARFRTFIRGEWYDTEVFADELARGGMKPFFSALAKKNVILVSSEEKRNAPIAYSHFIETPRTNTYKEKDRIIGEVLEHGKPGVYLFACGMAAGPIVAELHGKIPNSFFIDIGHMFDPFIGENSRFYLNDVPKELILSNLP